MVATQKLVNKRNKIKEELKQKGVISVEGYLPPDTCDKIRKEVNDSLEKDKFEMASENKMGAQMSNASRTIVNRRSGKDDDGMLDIFNIDETIPELGEIKNDDYISSIINGAASHSGFGPENINLYYNRSVTGTRGYHFDSYNSQYKAFVYLTDVPDESHGPYSYIEGSHRKSLLRRRFEGLINKTKGNKPTAAISMFYDDDDIVTFTAPKGTLIISDQTGYHRGIPQAEGRERMLVSNSYTSS